MIMAYASGNAANKPPPPRTSHVSFPSQKGAIEFIIRSRHESEGAKGKRMPTPRSNPSNTTYRNIAVEIKANQTSGKSITESKLNTFSSLLRGQIRNERWLVHSVGAIVFLPGPWSLLNQTKDIVAARTENQCIDDDESQK